jgi:hypothetical protein
MRTPPIRYLALALVLASGTGAARAESEAAPDPLGGWRHGISVAWDLYTFGSQAGSQYTIQSLAITYAMSTARSGVFVQASFLVPLVAAQDGTVHAVGDFYSPAAGIDLLAGWEWRLSPGAGLELEVGPGLHVAMLNMNGNATYVSFSTAPVGVGGQATLRWRPGWTLLGLPVSVGGLGAVTVDFFDPLHADDLKVGFSFRLGLLAGLDWI